MARIEGTYIRQINICSSEIKPYKGSFGLKSQTSLIYCELTVNGSTES